MHFGGVEHEGTVYRVEELPSGLTLTGPAVIEEPTTTIVLDPGTRAVTRSTHYLVTLDAVDEDQPENAPADKDSR
jgi:N-methylhydantoinase A/oxoprolinase/acetone carboxylase beta subunit